MNHVSKDVWFEVYDFYHTEEANVRDEILLTVNVEDAQSIELAYSAYYASFEEDDLYERTLNEIEFFETHGFVSTIDSQFSDDREYHLHQMIADLQAEHDAEQSRALFSSNLLTYIRAVA